MSMKQAPFVSVIILNYNGKSYLENCISSVLRTNYSNFEVILFDNFSTDSSLRTVEAAFENDHRLRIIRNNENSGFSGGNNLGLSYSKGTYVVFLNNDTVVDPDWLAFLVDALENDQSIGLAQSLLLTLEGEKIQLAGWLFSNNLLIQYPLESNKPSDLKLPAIIEISYASGAAMIIRRDLIDEIGLFESNVPFFYDDTLLSLKTWLANKKVVTVTKSKVRHKWGSKQWNVPFTSYNFYKAQTCLIFSVYFDLSDLAKALLLHFLSFSIDSILKIGENNLPVFLANARALKWVISDIKYIWRTRLTIWSKASISSKAFLSKFVRLQLPSAIYLTSTEIGISCYKSEGKKYENTLALRNAQYLKIH